MHTPIQVLTSPTIGPCLSLICLLPSRSQNPRLPTQHRSYQGAGVSAGSPPRSFLREPLSLPCCHQCLADGSQELSKEAPGPPSVPNLLLLGRSLAGGEKAAVGWAKPGLRVPLSATRLRGPQWPLSHHDVPEDPGTRCFLRTQGKEKEERPDMSYFASHILSGKQSQGRAP